MRVFSFLFLLIILKKRKENFLVLGLGDRTSEKTVGSSCVFLYIRMRKKVVGVRVRVTCAVTVDVGPDTCVEGIEWFNRNGKEGRERVR